MKIEKWIAFASAILIITVGMYHAEKTPPSLVAVQALQLERLPDDVVFTASDGIRDDNWNGVYDFKYNILGRIDSETLGITRFYEDETASLLKPLSWSPQGDFLAILHILSTADDIEDIASICILTSQGELHSCFDEKPSGLRTSIFSDVEYEYITTWSADGQSVYFVVEDVIGNLSRRRLVEADIHTGATRRTLYQTEYVARLDYGSPTLSWTPDLKYVVVGVADWGGARILPPRLVDLTTKEETLLETVEGEEIFGVCPFSPLGNYLVAVERNPTKVSFSVSHFVVFSQEGRVTRDIDVTSYNTLNYDCPTWSVDERFFYFNTSAIDSPSYVMFYQLEQDNLHEHLQLDGFHVNSMISLSPDETCLAFNSYPSTGYSGQRITIACPSDQVLHLDPTPFTYAQWPIWVPTDESE